MNEKANNVNEFWAACRDAVVGAGVQEDIASGMFDGLKGLLFLSRGSHCAPVLLKM
jgi:hypothetical protein